MHIPLALIQGGKAEADHANLMYRHPDSPNYGSHWTKELISFDAVKLTNKTSSDGQIMLNSSHKYEPCVRVVRLSSQRQAPDPLSGLVFTRSFPPTQFIAVTAYQNEDVIRLKNNYNPFARAFLQPQDRVIG